LEARGILVKAHEAGLERNAIFAMARRLKPDEALNIGQAIAELEKAVSVALDVIARGERGSNLGDFIDSVLVRVAKQTKAGAFDKAAEEVDAGLVELVKREAEQRAQNLRARVALLEIGIEQELLRRDAPAAARRIESLTAVQTEERPVSWSRAFR